MNKMQRLLNLFKQRECTYKAEKKNIVLCDVQEQVDSLDNQGRICDSIASFDDLHMNIGILYICLFKALVDGNKDIGHNYIVYKTKISIEGVNSDETFLLTIDINNKQLNVLVSLIYWTACRFAKTKSGCIDIDEVSYHNIRSDIYSNISILSGLLKDKKKIKI